jgi:hypothetical protein
MTYIRFWQAEGESLKTSARVTDAGEHNDRAGKWRGGCPPYGYHSVSRGTLNYKGKPIFDVEIDPETSEVVKTVFRLYGREHYGGKGIAKYLNDRNIPSAEGGMWNCSLILKMLKNKMYIGIYELGRAKKNRTLIASPIMEKLVIVSEQDFNEVQALLCKNNPNKAGVRPTRRGSLMLTGLLYCGECGRKFTSASFRQTRQRQNGGIWEYSRDTYRCSSYYVPREGQPDCNQKIFTAENLESMVVRDAKELLRTVDREKLMRSHKDTAKERQKEVSERLKKLTREITQKGKETVKLKDEVVKTILGESQFSQSLLSELLQTKETEIAELRKRHAEAEQAAEELEAELAAQKAVTDEIDTWAERFNTQNVMDKKAMLINIIDRITVNSDNRVVVKYKVKLKPTNSPTHNSYANCENAEDTNAFLYPQFVNRYPQATVWTVCSTKPNFTIAALRCCRLSKT